MRKRILGGLALSGLLLATGIGTATTASAASWGPCQYTSRTPLLRAGSGDHTAVKQLQCELNNAFYHDGGFHKPGEGFDTPGTKPIAVDGYFGQNTADAVRLFQKCAQGLDVDGAVGPKTWAELDYEFTNRAPMC